jgi:hypothetical protein
MATLDQQQILANAATNAGIITSAVTGPYIAAGVMGKLGTGYVGSGVTGSLTGMAGTAGADGAADLLAPGTGASRYFDDPMDALNTYGGAALWGGAFGVGARGLGSAGNSIGNGQQAVLNRWRSMLAGQQPCPAVPRYASQVTVGRYLAGEAPLQVQPGVRNLTGYKIETSGAAPRVQPWTASYDQYGRLIGRTDFNAANPAVGIPDTHYHTYQWGTGMNPLETGSHLPGEYQQ